MILALGCNSQKKSNIDENAYLKEIEVWHEARVSNDLKGPNGWLNLAGLYWLKEGFNTFGSGQDNDLVFPETKIDENAGTFFVQQGKVTMELNPGVTATVEGQPVSKLVIYKMDSSFHPVINHDSLQWFVIRRDNQLGIRLRDLNSEAVTSFAGVERYPVDLNWRIEGEWEAAPAGKTIEITNILGQTYPQPSPGTLVFSVEGKTYRLDAIDEGGDEYFIIYADPTNEHDTYPSGRYMYVKKPDAEGKVVVDFNKGYNPPCAFTAFATCPLPPKQNWIDVPITAGEKNYGKH